MFLKPPNHPNQLICRRLLMTSAGWARAARRRNRSMRGRHQKTSSEASTPGIFERIFSFQFPASISTAGFTLLEILIAIFIFAVVITTIFGSFNFVFGNIDAVEEGTAVYDMAKDCLNRMTLDLQSMYVLFPPEYKPPEGGADPDPFRVVGEPSDLGAGEFNRLRFTALAHLPLGRPLRNGVAEITYYVTAEEDGTKVLRRSDRLDFFEPPPELRGDPILCENLKAIRFTYIDLEGAEQEEWDSDSDALGNATPRAVKIKLEIGTEENFLKFETTVILPQFRESLIAGR